MRQLIPILSLLIKELLELASRPWQVLTLVLGPLAMLVCFGIGSDALAKPPRTIIVVPAGQEQPRLLRDYQRQFNEALRVVDTTDDEAYARSLLRRDVVDAVVILPPTPFATIAGGKRATVRVLYNQIDPIWRLTVPNFSQVLASEINRAIFLKTVGEQQEALTTAGAGLDTVLGTLALASEAADLGDRAELRRLIGLAIEQSTALEDALEQLGPTGAGLRADALRAGLRATRQRLDQLGATLDLNDGRPLREQLGLVEGQRRLRELQATLDELGAVPPEVVIAPLDVEPRNLAPLEPDLITFYAPGIVALLVQHVAVSLGALVFVRERLAGTFDLYTVAPIGRLQLLLGKYLAILLVTLLVVGAIVAVLLAGLGVPLLGSHWSLVLSLLLLALAAVGLGLTLSLLASSERQAVQFALLTLLGVVFFSGFTLPLHALRQPALGLAMALPATYGTVLLQNVMLRGALGAPFWSEALAGIAAALFVACFALLRWRTRAV